MDKKNDNLDVSTEEQNAEKEALEEVQDDDLRDQLADEMGLDPESDNEILDKVVAREKANREKLSGAIQQKINWRKKAKQGTSENSDDNPDGKDPKALDDGDAQDIDKIVDRKIQEKMDNLTLKELGLPDDIEEEVKTLAKVKGVSVGEAAELPYIMSLREAHAKDDRIKGGTPRRSRKGSYVSGDSPNDLDYRDFPIETEEDIKKWQEAKKKRREANN